MPTRGIVRDRSLAFLVYITWNHRTETDICCMNVVYTGMDTSLLIIKDKVLLVMACMSSSLSRASRLPCSIRDFYGVISPGIKDCQVLKANPGRLVLNPLSFDHHVSTLDQEQRRPRRIFSHRQR
jgi:hypothetical protein